VEDQVGIDPERTRSLFEHDAIHLTLTLLDVWVCSTEQHIGHVRMTLHDFRQGVDHVLNAFVRREQAECQNHAASFEPEAVLARRRCWKRWNPVGDEIDLLSRHAVDLAQQLPTTFAHDDDSFR
jgi:hypothetical protein